jgi:hypothetical protein
MIPKDHITEWRAHAPWAIDAQVEQDLVISRALVEMFRVPELANSLTFRGGTALYKLYFTPAARYSEDIDLVQVRSEPVGKTIDRARSVLDPWLGTPRRQLKEGRANLVYRFASEDAPPLKMRLKVEVNTREHFGEPLLSTAPGSAGMRRCRHLRSTSSLGRSCGRSISARRVATFSTSGTPFKAAEPIHLP